MKVVISLFLIVYISFGIAAYLKFYKDEPNNDIVVITNRTINITIDTTGSYQRRLNNVKYYEENAPQRRRR